MTHRGPVVTFYMYVIPITGPYVDSLRHRDTSPMIPPLVSLVERRSSGQGFLRKGLVAVRPCFHPVAHSNLS
eukprot:5078145-Amphidinium_carterae.1